MLLTLCGDIVPTQTTIPTFDAGDAQGLMGDALPVLRKSDFTIGNLECSLSNCGKPIRKCGPNLKGKPEYASVLKDCGFTHLGLSNNHVMDFGVAAMRQMIQALRIAGITPFGFGENDQDSRRAVYLEKDGVRAAVYAVCEHEYSYALEDQFGSNPFDPFDSMEDITIAKKQADFVIVMYHGGKEQCQFPSPRLRKACRAMVRAGADLVLCEHSHCIGCRENYQGSEIVYGLGNFNFVEYPDHPHWESGLMLQATLDKKDGLQAQYLPVIVTDTGITLAHGDKAFEILSGFSARSKLLCDQQAWRSAWRDFCIAVQQGYRKTIQNAYTNVAENESASQHFAHYIDCEAHLDVIKTLYPTWHSLKQTER